MLQIGQNKPKFVGLCKRLGTAAKRKVEFVSVSEQFDTTTPIGKAMIYIAMVFAQMERETISQRITDNYYTRTAHGAWGGGQPPFGFSLSRRLINGKMQAALEPIPHDIDIAKWMFEEYATGIRSLGWIASGVYDKHPTRDTRWNNVSVRRILKTRSTLPPMLIYTRFSRRAG